MRKKPLNKIRPKNLSTKIELYDQFDFTSTHNFHTPPPKDLSLFPKLSESSNLKKTQNKIIIPLNFNVSKFKFVFYE